MPTTDRHQVEVNIRSGSEEETAPPLPPAAVRQAGEYTVEQITAGEVDLTDDSFECTGGRETVRWSDEIERDPGTIPDWDCTPDDADAVVEHLINLARERLINQDIWVEDPDKENGDCTDPPFEDREDFAEPPVEVGLVGDPIENPLHWNNLVFAFGETHMATSTSFNNFGASSPVTDINLLRTKEVFQALAGIPETEFLYINMPNSVYVTQNREIFIADTNNNRIVVLDWDGDFVREITAPTVEGLEDDFIFLPLHVLVDRGGRLFVIVQRVFGGIMSFAPNGEFLGYFGTISINFNPNVDKSKAKQYT